MRPTIPALALLFAVVTLAGCARFRTERRTLVSTKAGGVDLSFAAELHGWHTPGHMGTEFKWMSARDDFAIVGELGAKSGTTALRVYDSTPREIATAPASMAEGRTRLAALTAVSCPLPLGVALRVGTGPWTASFVLGTRVFRIPLDLDAADCAGVTAKMPAGAKALAAHPGGATTCLALEQGGFRDDAIDCLLSGRDDDETPFVPFPASGPLSLDSTTVVYEDRDALIAILATDPTAVATMIDRLATHPPAYGDVLLAQARLQTLKVAGKLPAFVERVAAQCAAADKPCGEDSLKHAQEALNLSGNGSPTGEICASATALAKAVAARKEPGGARRAFFVLRGFYSCLDDVRPILLEGLRIATSPDTKLPSADYTAYSLIDPNCQLQPAAGGRSSVSALCESFPRFAGSWFATHCGPDAIAVAVKIAKEAPRKPFDPREDQVLDGALRVLGACAPKELTDAIAHMPDKTELPDIRSREQLRAVFVPDAGR